MSRMNHTNNYLVEFNGEMDKGFEILESEIKIALDIIDVYKKLVKSQISSQNARISACT